MVDPNFIDEEAIASEFLKRRARKSQTPIVTNRTATAVHIPARASANAARSLSRASTPAHNAWGVVRSPGRKVNAGTGGTTAGMHTDNAAAQARAKEETLVRPLRVMNQRHEANVTQEERKAFPNPLSTKDGGAPMILKRRVVCGSSIPPYSEYDHALEAQRLQSHVRLKPGGSARRKHSSTWDAEPKRDAVVNHSHRRRSLSHERLYDPNLVHHEDNFQRERHTAGVIGTNARSAALNQPKRVLSLPNDLNSSYTRPPCGNEIPTMQRMPNTADAFTMSQVQAEIAPENRRHGIHGRRLTGVIGQKVAGAALNREPSHARRAATHLPLPVAQTPRKPAEPAHTHSNFEEENVDDNFSDGDDFDVDSISVYSTTDDLAKRMQEVMDEAKRSRMSIANHIDVNFTQPRGAQTVDFDCDDSSGFPVHLGHAIWPSPAGDSFGRSGAASLSSATG